LTWMPRTSRSAFTAQFLTPRRDDRNRELPIPPVSPSPSNARPTARQPGQAKPSKPLRRERCLCSSANPLPAMTSGSQERSHAELHFAIFVALLVCSAQVPAQTTPGTTLWAYEAADIINGSAALASHGTVYIAAGLAVYAITNTGSVASTNCGSATPLQS
jgi:hypothetical protein